MKSILVPIDFSLKSENALKYAIDLNQQLKAEVKLLGSFQRYLFTHNGPLIDIPDSGIKDYVENEIREMKKNKEMLFPGTKFSSHIIDGFSWTGILEDEKINDADLIVLGIDKTNPISNFLTTGLSFNIIQKSILPVIAIPPEARYSGIKKIVFAANYGTDDFKNASDLISFAKIFDAEIVLFHISDNTHEFDFNEFSIFASHLCEEYKYNKISVKVYEDRDVYHGINKYLEENHIDLFSISMRNRSFYSRDFQPSLTKKMVYHSNIPTLIFHTGY